jgi:tyrosine-protein kinase Etk/Wzc
MYTASPDDIDISAIWHSLRRSVPKLLVLSLTAGVAAYVILSFVAPEYTSEAQIQLVAPKREVQANDPASADALAARMDKEAINTHVRALMSPDLAVEVIAAEGLANKPEFNSALQTPTLIGRIIYAFDFGRGTETEQERVLRAYFDRLDVYSPKESRFIGIRFTSQDPKLAADVANKLAELYRTSLATRTVAETDEVQKALQPKIDKLMKEVAEGEAAVERFRGEANIFKGGPNDTGLNQQQLADLNAELTKAQAARSEAEAKATAAREMVRAGNAESLPDVQKSPLIENLVQQRVRLQRQLSELSATLLPAHPRMRQIQADLEGLQRQIKAEVSKIVEGIEKGAQAAALHEAASKKNLDDSKALVVNTGDDQVKLRQLEAVAKSKRQELEQLQARFEANRARADSQAVPIEAQIITSARPSSVPSFPKKLPYSALVAAAFLLFGIAIVVTKALFTAARAPSADVAWQGSPAFARTEAKHARSGVERAAAVSTGVMHAIDSVDALASQLLVRPPDIGGFRTLITGETEGIDAGAAGVDLAKALADAGADVMLVDWSADGHGVAEAIGAQTHPGLGELLQGKARFEDVVARVPGSAAHLIPAGTAATSPDAMLDSDQINLALDALDTAYDHIVIVGSNQAARALFEAIQGRFDAGVIVSEGKRRARLTEPAGTFLGFEVADIELFRLERPASNRLVQERLARLTAKGGAEARPA